MAKLKSPLFSLDASGTLADAVTFSSWKGRSYCKRHSVPANPQSQLQTGIRAVFGFCAAAFPRLDPDYAPAWPPIAAAADTTPANAFIAFNVDRARRNLIIWPTPTSPDYPDGNAVESHLFDAATPQPGAIHLTWSQPEPPPKFARLLYRATDIGDFMNHRPYVSNLIAALTPDVLSFTDRDVTPGTRYLYAIFQLDTWHDILVIDMAYADVVAI